MTRVIHTGDTHIGYRQYHSAERRSDFLAAFRQVAEDAVGEDVDAVVHAGDLFHDRRPTIGDLLDTIDILGALDDADIPFLAIVGNHEGTREAQWLDLLERLGLATRLDREGIVVGETTFYGLDYVPPSRRKDLDYEFEPPSTEHTALVAHGLFEPFSYAEWDTEAVLDAANVDFDAMLLGDNHTPGRAEVADTWVTYCGSTERTSAAEREERGYNVVEFDGDVRIARRGLSVTREFVFVNVELGEGEGVDRVLDRVSEYDLEDAVVIVTIEGEGSDVAPAEVESFAADRGALVARVNDARDDDPEASLSVSFADPDDAVRDRVRDLGLSPAAGEIDETVRSGEIADSNVRGTVAERVRELVDEEGLDAFVSRDPDDETEGSAERESDEPPTDAPEPAVANGGTAAGGGDEPVEAEGVDPDADAPAGDGQASMEEYL